MDPVRNPYAPGAGQRPPELAGRDAQLQAFDVVLERVARGRPERSIVLTGLRGVGKTVLLNAMRSAAVRARLGHRQARGPARPAAAPPARRPRCTSPSASSAARDGRRRRAGARRAASPSPSEDAGAGAPSCATAGSRASTCPPCRGRADSGDIEIDLVELLTDIGGLAADAGRGVAIFIDEMQDLGPDDVSRAVRRLPRDQPDRPAARRRRCRAAAPAGGAVGEQVLLASGCSATPASTGSTGRRPTGRCSAPARDEDADFTTEALAAMYAATAGYPYFVQAYGKAAWDVAPRSPDHGGRRPGRRAGGRGGARGRASSGRATSGPRRPSGSTCGRWPTCGDAAGRRTPAGDEPSRCRPPRSPSILGRKPQSLSPARDGLMKKGLIYSGERGRIAFTVPHFGRYLRANG